MLYEGFIFPLICAWKSSKARGYPQEIFEVSLSIHYIIWFGGLTEINTTLHVFNFKILVICFDQRLVIVNTFRLSFSKADVFLAVLYYWVLKKLVSPISLTY